MKIQQNKTTRNKQIVTHISLYIAAIYDRGLSYFVVLDKRSGSMTKNSGREGGKATYESDRYRYCGGLVS